MVSTPLRHCSSMSQAGDRGSSLSVLGYWSDDGLAGWFGGWKLVRNGISTRIVKKNSQCGQGGLNAD